MKSIIPAFIFAFILLILPLVVSQSSSSEVNFTVPGCTLNGEKIGADSCSTTGRYFCTRTGQIWSTIEGGSNAGTACQGRVGGSQCCPSNMQCTSTGCVLSVNPCESYTNQDNCESNGACAWIYNGNTNLCRSRNALSCSDYTTSNSCLNDSMYLGKSGVGTEKCRTNAYTTTGKLIKNCRCFWNTTTGNCKLLYDINDLGPYIGTPAGFSCEKTFQVADCIGGQQGVSWTANPVIGAGYTPTVEEISQSDCLAGSKTLVCGENLIKLPFFSFINVISAILAISIIYLISLKKHYIYKTSKA